jgi:hypothetical protein
VTLDLMSVLVMTTLVVNVSGILFIVETLLRRDEGAGSVWALAFLAGMLTTLSYSLWAQTPDAWWAIAVGNAAFVASTGCMWLGCRRFNGRRMGWASAVVAVAVAVAGFTVALAGPGGGDPRGCWPVCSACRPCSMSRGPRRSSRPAPRASSSRARSGWSARAFSP